MAKRAQLPKSSKTQGAAKASTRVQTKAPASSRKLLLGVIGAVIVLAAGLIWLAIRANQTPIVATDRVGEGATWGPVGAPVQIVAYSDFGCSHCADFAKNQGKQLRAQYEATGQVRFEFKYFVIGGERSHSAAMAAECAADQGKFWDFHDVLFARQGTSSDPFSRSALKQYAAELGLDTTKFNQCLDSSQHSAAVNADSSAARGQGVEATPTFFVNGEQLVGAQPLSVFQQAIDAALAKAQ